MCVKISQQAIPGSLRTDSGTPQDQAPPPKRQKSEKPAEAGIAHAAGDKPDKPRSASPWLNQLPPKKEPESKSASSSSSSSSSSSAVAGAKRRPSILARHNKKPQAKDDNDGKSEDDDSDSSDDGGNSKPRRSSATGKIGEVSDRIAEAAQAAVEAQTLSDRKFDKYLESQNAEVLLWCSWDVPDQFPLDRLS